jgi:hypothetical protein
MATSCCHQVAYNGPYNTIAFNGDDINTLIMGDINIHESWPT